MPLQPDAAALLHWYDRHRRVLPWRHLPGDPPDPYRIWLSEIMLQQTTVTAVIPYFERFLTRFPTVAALAAAPEGDVLAAWAGLGYYARARNLHACARQVAALGGFPATVEGLRALPGIGVYTAAAVAAIAFAVPVVPVDGNVERVTARLFAIAAPMPGARPAIAAAAATLGLHPAAQARPSDFAQALFDLGATLCTPANPACALCPLMQGCEARRAGIAAELPRRAAKPARPQRFGAAFWLTDSAGAVLLRRRPASGLLGGMTELPGTPWLPHPAAPRRAPGERADAGSLASGRPGAARLHPFRIDAGRLRRAGSRHCRRRLPPPRRRAGHGGAAIRHAQMHPGRAPEPRLIVMRPQTASVAFVLATLGVDALGLGIVIPIVPALVQSLSQLDAGSAAQWVGALVATFAAAQFIAAPVLGGLSDRYGRRPVIIVSLFGTAANYLLLAFAPSLAWLFLGRLLAGATAASASAANAYIADVTPPELRSQRFGLVGATFGAGFVFGPALGGLLGSIDLRLPFLAAAALALANAAYGALLLPESLPKELRRRFSWRRANPVGSLRTLAADPSVGWMAFAWCCMWFGIGALQSTFVLSTAMRFGWGPQLNGWAFAAVGVSQALVQGLLVRPIIRRIGERPAAFTGFAFSALAYVMYGVAWQGWMIYLGVVLQGIGAIATPAMRGLLSTRAGPTRQGEMQGGLSSVEGLTAIAGPVAAASLFTYTTQWGGAALGGSAFLMAAAAYGLAMLALRKAS